MDDEGIPKEGVIALFLIFAVLIIQLISFLNVSNKGFLFILFLLCCLFFFFFWDSNIKKEELDNFLKIREEGAAYSLPEAPKEFP